MADQATAGIPEQGQIVDVRQRRYVVSEVAKSTLPADPLAAGNGRGQHLVSLTSIEDDALGEELQVIWELEPGALVYENMALPTPTGFDDPHRLDAFLNAVRWGSASSADVRALQSPFRSGIDIEDYQLDPVVRAIQMPRANLLIADDVGLGKTIEAGLVIQEMLIRQRARRVLVVTPASLQIHWRDQMRDHFGLEFRIVDAELMRELRRRRGIHVNPWTHFPRLIASIDFLKRDRPLRLFREVLPAEGELAYPRRFDILVVDEAHNVAPAGQGRYAIDSLRTAAIRLLAPHFEHKLFLSATPHNGYAESFSALLELLDNQRFARGIAPDRERLAGSMVRRMKSELTDWDGRPRFPERRVEAIEVEYTEAERQAYHWLQEYGALRQQHPAHADERMATEFVLKLLKKRMFSSPAGFAATLEQHERSLAGTTPAAGAGREPHRTRSGILRAMLEVEEEYADDAAYEEATASAVRATTSIFRQPTPTERELLGKLGRWAEQAAAQADSKAEVLVSWLKNHVRRDGQWSDERVIIFTEYRATQKWLQGLLAAEGLTMDARGPRLLSLYGGMPDDERERIKAAFQAGPEVSAVRILLATDAASEGIDLQLHCHRVIHYEIPWNPSRLEQRNGRIDRHGQCHNPLVYHFVPRGYREQTERAAPGVLEGDLEFLMRAAWKVEQIREDLGKVGPVIADQVAEAMLGRRRHLETSEAERASEPVRKLLKFERNLRAQIEKLHEQLKETERSLHLSPENTEAVVRVALELAGQPRLQEATLAGVWPDPSGERKQCPVFRLPALRGSWGLCAQGLAHPHTGEIRLIAFDQNATHGRDDVVLVHLNHRLVQMSLRLLRAEVWSGESAKKLHRVTARLVPDQVLSEPVVVAHARLVVTGGDSRRLHEEVLAAGGEIRQGKFRRLDQRDVQRILGAALWPSPGTEVKRRLADVFPGVVPGLRQSLEVRMRERVASLDALLADRCAREVSDIATVLGELDRSIRAELAAPEYKQLALDLFSAGEREQYYRNVEALERRLAQIPAEIEQETAVIRKRYADPRPRLFPMAVTFLVPTRMARG